MRPEDSLWLRLDRPENLMVITSLMWTTREVDPGRLRAIVRDRLVDQFPVLRQRPEIHGGPVRRGSWVDDADFDLDRHLVVRAMPGAGDRSALQHFVGEQRAVPLDPAHPMWRMHLLQGHRGGSALVTRFHHSVAEGIRSTQVLLGLLDPLEGEPPSLAARVGRSGPVHVGTDAAWPVTALLNTAFSVVKIGLWENPRTALDGRPGTEKAVTWTQPLPLAVIMGIGTRTGTTVNDVCTALVAGAMARYLACSAGAGRLVPGDDDVAWLVPVNLDPPGQQPPVELGNRFALVLALLPHGPAAFPDRAAEVHRRVQRIRTSWEPARTFGLSRVCSPSPRHLSVRRRSGSWPPRRWAC